MSHDQNYWWKIIGRAKKSVKPKPGVVLLLTSFFLSFSLSSSSSVCVCMFSANICSGKCLSDRNDAMHLGKWCECQCFCQEPEDRGEDGICRLSVFPVQNCFIQDLGNHTRTKHQLPDYAPSNKNGQTGSALLAVCENHCVRVEVD